MLAIGEVVEVYRVDLVDHLPQQLARLHEIVGVFKHRTHHLAAVGPDSLTNGQFFERRKQLAVDERHQRFAGGPFRIRRPGPPLELGWNRRGVRGAGQLQLLVLVVDDLEEEHPAELRQTLCIAINASVLAHDVLDGFDGSADAHGRFISDFSNLITQAMLA